MSKSEFEIIKRGFPTRSMISRFEEISKNYADEIETARCLVDTSLSDSPKDLFFLYNFLNPQKKAVSIERFIYTKMGGSKVSASLDRGDALIDGKYCEIKTSTTNEKENLNMRQIRLYQDVDKYICIYIDEMNLQESKTYVLTKEQMEYEVELIGGYTHGTKEANKGNAIPEYSITIPVKQDSNPSTQRWNKLYWNQELYHILNPITDRA